MLYYYISSKNECLYPLTDKCKNIHSSVTHKSQKKLQTIQISTNERMDK
jgi:hypothetical protein